MKNYTLGKKEIRRIQHIKLEPAYLFTCLCFLAYPVCYLSLVPLAAICFEFAHIVQKFVYKV